MAAGSLGLFRVLLERAPCGHSESVAARHPWKAPGGGLVTAVPRGCRGEVGAGDSRAERTRGRPDLWGGVCGAGARGGDSQGASQACAVANPPPGPVPAPIGQAIHRLLLIQAFRPDRLLAMAHMFVSTNLGESFMSIMEQPLDLTHIVDTEVRASPVGSELPICTSPHRALPTNRCAVGGPPPLTEARLPGPQVKPNTPVLMCSVPGYDASGHVEDLAAEQNTQITSIAIGKGGRSVPSPLRPPSPDITVGLEPKSAC